MWCGASEIAKIRQVLEARTLTYTKLGLLDESHKDVCFAWFICVSERTIVLAADQPHDVEEADDVFGRHVHGGGP